MNIAPIFAPIPLIVLTVTMPELILLWLIGAIICWVLSRIIFQIKMRITGTVQINGLVFKVRYNPLPFEKEVKMLINKLRKAQ